MASPYTSEIQTWEAANAYLGSKTDRPLPRCANLRIERIRTMMAPGREGAPTDTAEIVVKLHGHVIVRFPGPGLATEYPYKGQFANSLTTKRHRSAFGGPWKV